MWRRTERRKWRLRSLPATIIGHVGWSDPHVVRQGRSATSEYRKTFGVDLDDPPGNDLTGPVRRVAERRARVVGLKRSALYRGMREGRFRRAATILAAEERSLACCREVEQWIVAKTPRLALTVACRLERSTPNRSWTLSLKTRLRGGKVTASWWRSRPERVQTGAEHRTVAHNRP